MRYWGVVVVPSFVVLFPDLLGTILLATGLNIANFKYIACKMFGFRAEGMAIRRASGNPEDVFFVSCWSFCFFDWYTGWLGVVFFPRVFLVLFIVFWHNDF